MQLATKAKTFVSEAKLSIGGIKKTFAVAAGKAKNTQEVDEAYQAAFNSVGDTLGRIDQLMQDEILAVAKGFPLDEYRDEINTVMLEAKVEVDLIQADMISKFQVREFKNAFIE